MTEESAKTKLLQKELGNVQKLEKEFNTLRENQQLLNSQLSENEVVRNELNLADENDEVYKLIGPILVKQDLAEAKSVIGKRLEYIKDEIRRVNAVITSTDNKLKEATEQLRKTAQSQSAPRGK